MPRRNINAAERIDKRWSLEYIRTLLRKVRVGKIEQVYEEPVVEKDSRRKEGK